MHVLALSSSRVGGGAYLASAVPAIEQFLGTGPMQVAFVPFAAADGDYHGYAGRVREGLSVLGYSINVVMPSTAREVIESSQVIMVGGGNTFKLLHDIYHFDLFSLLQQKVKAGTPYIGWSAGANLTGKTIGTTNDMPIIQPQSFAAFGFFPFQLNPHYHNVVMEGFHGETRDQRLAEYLLLHPGTKIVGLPEGTGLQLRENSLQLTGNRPAALFRYNSDNQTLLKKELLPQTDLSFLLRL